MTGLRFKLSLAVFSVALFYTGTARAEFATVSVFDGRGWTVTQFIDPAEPDYSCDLITDRNTFQLTMFSTSPSGLEISLLAFPLPEKGDRVSVLIDGKVVLTTIDEVGGAIFLIPNAAEAEALLIRMAAGASIAFRIEVPDGGTSAGRELARYSLRGSAKAIDALRGCLAKRSDYSVVQNAVQAAVTNAPTDERTFFVPSNWSLSSETYSGPEQARFSSCKLVAGNEESDDFTLFLHIFANQGMYLSVYHRLVLATYDVALRIGDGPTLPFDNIGSAEEKSAIEFDEDETNARDAILDSIAASTIMFLVNEAGDTVSKMDLTGAGIAIPALRECAVYVAEIMPD